MPSDDVPHGVTVPPDRGLSRRAAIVGVGNTDYASDYKAARSREPGYVPPDSEGLAVAAFEAALADSGLERDDIDGLSLAYMYGDGDVETATKKMGINPRYAVKTGGLMAGLIPHAVVALAAGHCDTIAMVYSAVPKAVGRLFGGMTHADMGRHSYSYYHPWAWSSQAAHWAFMATYYQTLYGTTEADFGHVALTLREHAGRNPQAVMRDPLTIDDYLESRYIVRPLHLFDMCLPNDGGVCVILRRADLVSDLPHSPVLVAGWGDAALHDTKMHYMVRERLHSQIQEAARQTFDMSGLALGDVGHFQAYDASAFHIINQLEGSGFVSPGEGVEFCKDGQMALGGSLPTNTSGGMLSEAYMHGWNHVAEAVRQLRGEAGERQVADLDTSLFCLAETDRANTIVLTKGA